MIRARNIQTTSPRRPTGGSTRQRARGVKIAAEQIEWALAYLGDTDACTKVRDSVRSS